MNLLPYEPATLLGHEPARNAFVELHNVVAAAGAPGEMGRDALDRIARARGVDLRAQFRDERLGLYESLFDEALGDGRFSPDDRRWLGAAAETLGLAAADVAAIHERAFGDAVSVVLSDDCLDAGERLHLHALQRELGLDPDRAGALYHGSARVRLLQRVAHAMCDGELSPDEGAHITQAVRALGVALDASITAMLDGAAERWASRSGPLPSLPGASVPLHADEVAHADVPASWARKTGDELRDVFADDLSRAETRHQRLPWHRITAPTEGRVVLTNRRLVAADGVHNPSWISLARLGAVVPFKDGVVIQVRGTSRLWVLRLGAEARGFTDFLNRAADAIRSPPSPKGAAAWWRPLVEPDDPWRLAEAPLGWSLPGTVRSDGARLVLRTVTGETQVVLRRVARVEHQGETLAIRLTGRAGWLVRFADPAEAASLAERLSVHARQ